MRVRVSVGVSVNVSKYVRDCVAGWVGTHALREKECIRERECKEIRVTQTCTHADMHTFAHFSFSLSLFFCLSVLPRVCECMFVCA